MAVDIQALLKRVRAAQETVKKATEKYGGETTVKEAVERETAERTSPTPSPKPSPTPSPTTKPQPSPQPSSSPIPQDQKDSYTVKSGDTLSAIAQRQGVSLEEVKKANPQLERGQGYNLIYPGDVVNIPTAPGAGESPFDEVSKAETTGVGESDRETDREEEGEGRQEFEEDLEELDLESDYLDRLNKLKQQREAAGLDPDTGLPLTETPTPPTYYSKDDINSIENLGSEINDLKSTIRDVEASVTQGMYDEEGRLAPMELIGTRQRELQRQAQEQLDTLNRSLQTKIDSYNNKLSGIEMTANLRKMEWEDSKWEYQQDYNRAIALSNYFKEEENEIIQDAKANLTAIQNALAKSDVIFDDLSPEYKAKIRELERVSNIPEGTTQVFYNEEPKATVMHETKGVDDQGNEFVTFIYEGEDGRSGAKDIVYTGGVREVSGTGAGGAGTIDMTSTQYNKALTTSGLSGEDFSRLDEMSQRLFAYGDVKGVEKDIDNWLEEGVDPSEIERDISNDLNYPDPIKNHLVKYLKSKTGEYEERQEETSKKISRNIDVLADQFIGSEDLIEEIDDMESPSVEEINEMISKIEEAFNRAKRRIEEEETIEIDRTTHRLSEENKREILERLEARKNEFIEEVEGKKSWWQKLRERGRYSP